MTSDPRRDIKTGVEKINNTIIQSIKECSDPASPAHLQQHIPQTITPKTKDFVGAGLELNILNVFVLTDIST